MSVVELYLEDTTRIYCPRTGKLVLEPFTLEPSPAVLFTRDDQTVEFIYQRKDFRKAYRKFMALKMRENRLEDINGYDIFDAFLGKTRKLFEDYNIMVFALTGPGRGCPPREFTLYIGFDMNFENEY